MALPDPSKMRPSMSSDTPILRLCPVNSTLVYPLSVICSTDYRVFSDLLDIDAGGPFKYLSTISTGKSFQRASRDILGRQLGSLIICGISQLSCEAQVGSFVPRASSTCPDLSEPSGRVKETISLYLGNLT